MRANKLILIAAFTLLVPALKANSQSDNQTGSGKKHHGKSTAGEYGSGAGDAGKGAAGGAGNAAKGAGDYATLHPVKGTEAVGKGGKDVGVGAAKGTGKVVKGTGKVLTHPF